MPRKNHPPVIVPNGRDDLPLKENGKRWNRNTSYKPEYADKMVELMTDGYSRAEVCKTLAISPMAFDDWVKDFPDFRDAYKLGTEYARSWFEERMRQTLLLVQEKDGPTVKFNDKTYAHTMAVRFGVTDKRPAINVNLSADNTDEELDRVKDLVKKLHTETI
jgi:hypothetical protein